MRILKIFNKKEKIKEKIIEIIKKALIKGRVIMLPTDTVYGLVCDAGNKKAVRRIFEIKKRPLNKPIGVFVKNIKMAKEITEIDIEQEKLLKTKWPGKFTFILRKKSVDNKTQQIFCGTKQSIGMRIPDYELTRALFEKIDFPLAQTSANISGNPATTKISQVLKQFENQKIQPDLIIDTGNLLKSKPSTVIDLTGKEAKILRK